MIFEGYSNNIMHDKERKALPILCGKGFFFKASLALTLYLFLAGRIRQYKLSVLL